MEHDAPVTIRDYFLALRTADKELREADAKLSEERDRRYSEVQELRDENLRLQALEYERRLTGLNHEQARIEERNRHYVSVDKYSSDMAAIIATRVETLQRIEARIDPLADWVKVQQLKGVGISSLWVVVVMAVSAAASAMSIFMALSQ